MLLTFADVVYLDAKTDTYLEEVSSCNIFVRKGKTIKTPALAGTILPGMQTSSSWGFTHACSLSYTESEIKAKASVELIQQRWIYAAIICTCQKALPD